MRIQRSLPLLAAVAALLGAAPALGAQVITDSQSDAAQAAYLAISLTQMGALTPMASARDGGLATKGPRFRAQFANRDEGDSFSRRTFAGGIDLPFGANTLGLTAGYVDFTCDTKDAEAAGLDVACKGTLMAGADFTVPLVRNPLGTGDGSIFTMSAMLSGGYGSGEILKLTDPDPTFGGSFTAKTSGWAAGVQFPLAIALKSEGVTVVPNLRPGFAYGHAKAELESSDGLSDSGTDGGTRFMLGGGLGLVFRNSGIGLDVGAQKVFVKDGKTLFGVGLSFGGR